MHSKQIVLIPKYRRFHVSGGRLFGVQTQWKMLGCQNFIFLVDIIDVPLQ